MNDQEINRKLSLAIGWRYHRYVVTPNSTGLEVASEPDGPFHNFDFMDWRVAGPIAQRYNCFPHLTSGMWCAYFGDGRPAAFAHAPQKAIALAVIAAHEAGVLPHQTAPGG